MGNTSRSRLPESKSLQSLAAARAELTPDAIQRLLAAWFGGGRKTAPLAEGLPSIKARELMKSALVDLPPAAILEVVGREVERRGCLERERLERRRRPLVSLVQPGTLRRFLSKIVFPSDIWLGCWLWRGAQDHGYGCIRIDGRTVKTHRYSVELFSGTPVPRGLVIDHLCRNPPCVNPTHLEVVTPRENLVRGYAPTILAWKRGTCLRGHERTAQNARMTAKGWFCVACQRLRYRAYRRNETEVQRQTRLEYARNYNEQYRQRQQGRPSE